MEILELEDFSKGQNFLLCCLGIFFPIEKKYHHTLKTAVA